MRKIRSILQILGIFLIASCNREEVIGNVELPSDDKIAVNTEVSVDGVDLADVETRASSAAGYTTGDGLYDTGDPVTVAAYANNGYELVRFYDKKYPSVNLGSSHNFRAMEPQTFKAEFRTATNYTITVTASPSAGGSATGGGSYKGGSSCTVKATANSGYSFDGWYEGSSKVSSSTSYTFTVSSARTLTAKFEKKGVDFIAVGSNGCISYKNKALKVGTNHWSAITGGAGKYVAVGYDGYITSSTDGENWYSQRIGTNKWNAVAYGNGRFMVVGENGYVTSSIDGVNWSAPTQPNADRAYNALTFGDDKFVALSGSYSFISTNGLTWDSFEHIGQINSSYDIVYGNGKFVLIGQRGEDAAISISTDTDAVKWHYETILIGLNPYKYITYGNGKFVLIGGFYWGTSTDGEIWNKGSLYVPNNPPYLNDVDFGNGCFVAGGDGGVIYISTDGENWEQIDSNVTERINAIYVIK